jgi:hypothetical protein
MQLPYKICFAAARLCTFHNFQLVRLRNVHRSGKSARSGYGVEITTLELSYTIMHRETLTRSGKIANGLPCQRLIHRRPYLMRSLSSQ